MTGAIASAVVDKVALRLGMTFNPSQVRAENVASDLAEKTARVEYPSVGVYCEKISNELVEKFRRFSGRVQVAVVVRLSSDRLDGLQAAVEQYVDSIGDMLSQNRGDWSGGMFYDGKYEVAFGAVKHGGKNFIQAAKVIFEIGVSRD